MVKPKQKSSKLDLFVIARLLDILWSRGSKVKKTHLQLASKLNYNIYIKYLNWLEKKSLIEILNTNSRNTCVKITLKGIDAYKKIIGWIREFVDEIEGL